MDTLLLEQLLASVSSRFIYLSPETYLILAGVVVIAFLGLRLMFSTVRLIIFMLMLLAVSTIIGILAGAVTLFYIPLLPM